MKEQLSLMILITIVTFLTVGRTPQALAYDPTATRPLLAHETPRELEDIGIDEHLGRQLDLSLPFVSDKGDAVTLGEYFNGSKPVLLTMVYYSCPSLCNFHLNGLLDVFKKMNLVAGKDFQMVAVSMNHRE